MLKICYRIEVCGRLLTAETSIEVAADRGMLAVSCQLADVINMIGNVCKGDALIILRTACPARAQHPVIEGNANHASPRDDGADLFVIELALVGNQGTAIIVAGENDPSKTLHGFPERLI